MRTTDQILREFDRKRKIKRWVGAFMLSWWIPVAIAGLIYFMGWMGLVIVGIPLVLFGYIGVACWLLD